MGITFSVYKMYGRRRNDEGKLQEKEGVESLSNCYNTRKSFNAYFIAIHLYDNI